MNLLLAATWAETLKIRRSKMLWLSVLAAVFITAMIGFMVFISKNPELGSKLGLLSMKASIVQDADWSSYLSLLSQLVAGVGAIVFGFITAWIFGREYSDRTVKDLLALPVPRSYLVLSKFVVVAIWCVAFALIMVVSGLLIGWMVGLTGWSGEMAVHNVYIFAITAIMTLLLCTPVAFFASYGRGYLPPIGFVILTLITAQFVGMLGIGPYFPWAIPGLYSLSQDPAGMQLVAASYVILLLTSLIGLAATFAWWRYADQS